MLDACNMPCAAKGFISYRCRPPYGWIMIGALDTQDAINEAKRSSSHAVIDTLERWNNNEYIKVTQ